MNIKNILDSVQLPPRKALPEKAKEVRLLRFDSFQFSSDPDFKISFHNQPVPVTPHTHDYYEATYVYRGTFIHQTENGRSILTTGDVIVIPPDAVHGILECSLDCHGINMLISRSFFTTHICPLLNTDTQGLVNGITHFSCSDNPRLRSLVDSLLEELFLPGEPDKQFIRCYLALLLNTCCRLSLQRYSSDKERKEAQKKTQTAKMVQYIHLNYQTASLPGLSSVFGYSENYISHLIKEETGYSFSEYKLKVQLDEAAQLLAQSTLSVNRIADLTGFTNYSYFYRKFKEKTGSTPAAYRDSDVNFSTPSR